MLLCNSLQKADQREMGEAKLKERNANSMHNMHCASVKVSARLLSLPTLLRVVVCN